MSKNIKNVEVAMICSPDNEVAVFIRDNEADTNYLLCKKQLHTDSDNTTAKLVWELWCKRELDYKELTNILGGEVKLKKKINKAFNFLPQSSIEKFFPVFAENKVKFTPKIKLTDFIPPDTNITFKSGKTKKQSLESYEEKIACYLFNVHTDGSYELERSCQHNFMAENFCIDYQFYDNDNFEDWKLFNLPNNLQVNLMWLSPMPELDSLAPSDNESKST